MVEHGTENPGVHSSILCPGTFSEDGGVLVKRIASAQKQARKSEKRREFYRGKRQALKSALENLAAAKSKEEAIKLLPGVQSLIDKSAKRRMVHRKTASRLKSRLAREAADLK